VRVSLPKIILCLLLAFSTLAASAQSADVEQLRQQVETHAAAGNQPSQADALNRLGMRLWELKRYDEAIAAYQQSLELNRSIGNRNAQRAVLYNIGMIRADQGMTQEAVNALQQSADMAGALGQRPQQTDALLQAAIALDAAGRHQEAIPVLNKALDIAAGLNDLRLMKNCHGLLMENHKALGNTALYESAFANYAALDRKIRDLEQEEMVHENERVLEEMTAEARQELLLKEQELRLAEDSLKSIDSLTQEQLLQIQVLNQEQELNQLALKQQQALLDKEQQARKFFIIGIVAAGLFLAFMAYALAHMRRSKGILLKQNQEIHTQNLAITSQKEELQKQSDEIKAALQKIQKQNEAITNSINYAQRIQKAMLDQGRIISDYVADSFILFRPRDVVSGDFYWVREVGAELDAGPMPGLVSETPRAQRNLAFAAIDCTGHGVPGAFMSMIGFNLLNEIAREGMEDAADVLNRLHLSIRAALNQESSENRDGMDMALCIIDRENRRMHFAGAKNPLIYFQEGQMFSISGDKHPIGGLQREERRIFTNHVISLEKPTTVYLFSDGYQDQFGGPQNRKFLKKNLYQLLEDNHDRPMTRQKAILEQTYDNWKEDYKQMDDMLVLGVRV